jgi:hypothetical protein
VNLNNKLEQKPFYHGGCGFTSMSWRSIVLSKWVPDIQQMKGIGYGVATEMMLPAGGL